MEEDKSPYGTSDSEGKNPEAISDSNTSLEDHNSTDNSSNTGPSDNQQINEGERTSDTTDHSQKILEEGHDIEKKEATYEEGDSSGMKSEPESDTMTEAQRKSHDEEEQKKEDNNEPPRQEPTAAPTTALNLDSSVGGDCNNEDRPPERRVTWSPNLVRILSSNEDETDKSDDQVNSSGENGKENGSKGADASEDGESSNGSGSGGSDSNGEQGQNGTGNGEKEG